MRNHGLLQLDQLNAFNTVARDIIYQILPDTPTLRYLLPMFRMLYLDREPPLQIYNGYILHTTI